MKKKINLQFIMITAIAIIFTAVFSGIIFYEIFKTEVMEEIKSYAHLLTAAVSFEELEENLSEKNIRNLRITVMNKDGTVQFDTNADIGGMDNHRRRPEIMEAMKYGEGETIRKSETLDTNTFYYAIRLEDGGIIRVAKESSSIYHVFLNSFPYIGMIAVILFFICIVISHILTKSLIFPIEKMSRDIDHVSEINTYKELIPFMNTIQKQHEDILKNAKLRQEFTANVSHELKTPPTSISGYSELIENGMADNEDIIRFAREIHRNSNRLLTLINDIIRLSELDTVDMNVGFERLNLYDLAFNCVEMLKMNAEKHKVTISIKGQEVYILGNRQMIDEMIYNLCDNAIRYNNENGTVAVTVMGIRRFESEHGRLKNEAVLSVKDTGIGIPKKHQQRIFERFYRVDKSRSKSTGGTGLGLAIVKHIVAGHKGAAIELESDSGKGTEIKIIFPADE